MYRSDITIKEGAIFIADAHYASSKPALYDFLQKIASKEINPPQLFLLGDIFDALFGGVPHTKKKVEELVQLLDTISKEIEVVYLEGNHDFVLEKYFSHMKIFSIAKQPVEISTLGKKVWIAHGDFDAPLGYKIYTKFIRSPFVLFFLNLYDSFTNHSILNFVDAHMAKKEECKELEWFDDFVKNRIKRLHCDLYIDGHFHQNKTYTFENLKYINLGAFACNQRYFVVKFVQDEIFLEEHSAS